MDWRAALSELWKHTELPRRIGGFWGFALLLGGVLFLLASVFGTALRVGPLAMELLDNPAVIASFLFVAAIVAFFWNAHEAVRKIRQENGAAQAAIDLVEKKIGLIGRLTSLERALPVCVSIMNYEHVAMQEAKEHLTKGDRTSSQWSVRLSDVLQNAETVRLNVKTQFRSVTDVNLEVIASGPEFEDYKPLEVDLPTAQAKLRWKLLCWRYQQEAPLANLALHALTEERQRLRDKIEAYGSAVRG